MSNHPHNLLSIFSTYALNLFRIYSEAEEMQAYW